MSLDERIIHYITKYGDMSRSRLSRKMQEPVATLYSHLKKLELQKVLFTYKARSVTRGRRQILYGIVKIY